MRQTERELDLQEMAAQNRRQPAIKTICPTRLRRANYCKTGNSIGRIIAIVHR
ncbi:hypothetical protein [Rhizobium ruizarguesonis]|uniref:hypothetical protein n=1 Tax=Rhizobium ruizarguesonis TaxID=2081791 RepID=UPI0013EEC021|nr:hypothetical protein [Rhizobium ruizarguesonis]